MSKRVCQAVCYSRVNIVEDGCKLRLDFCCKNSLKAKCWCMKSRIKNKGTNRMWIIAIVKANGAWVLVNKRQKFLVNWYLNAVSFPMSLNARILCLEGFSHSHFMGYWECLVMCWFLFLKVHVVAEMSSPFDNAILVGVLFIVFLIWIYFQTRRGVEFHFPFCFFINHSPATGLCRIAIC